MVNLNRVELYAGTEDDLVRQFLPRVKYYASKYSFALPPELSTEDLVSAGVIGFSRLSSDSIPQ